MPVEEFIIVILLSDFLATIGGTVAIWKRVSSIDHRLTILETKYCIQVNGVRND